MLIRRPKAGRTSLQRSPTGADIVEIIDRIRWRLWHGQVARALDLSKYPPAKPGALECWPLKAAGGVANAAPGSCEPLKAGVGGADATPDLGGH
jgi:hypothetical protein